MACIKSKTNVITEMVPDEKRELRSPAIERYSTVSPSFIAGRCVPEKAGSFISILQTSTSRILAGFFCLSIPVTKDNSGVSRFNYTPASQSKYNYYGKDRE